MKTKSPLAFGFALQKIAEPAVLPIILVRGGPAIPPAHPRGQIDPQSGLRVGNPVALTRPCDQPTLPTF
jgi:hypothetical protein